MVFNRDWVANNIMHSSYLWGSFELGIIYTHSLLVKVFSIQDFCDWKTKKGNKEYKPYTEKVLSEETRITTLLI